ncbi:ankyrin repeat-containing domain protein [Fennellomyces sp. T-0311]|nr:ankyrin repeat-containing domain protein [Fennellomyces sp. T-0311]
MPRRHRHTDVSAAKRARYPSSSSSASSITTSVFDDAADSDMSGQEEFNDDDDERLRRKRKLEKNSSSSRKTLKVSQPQEKRRRGRPRKESTSEAPEGIERRRSSSASSGKDMPRRKPKGRVPCQDPNKPDKAGRTKLFVFTGSGHLDKVKELVERGANVNFRDNAGWTPLHEASLKGQNDVARFLIACGADVNARGFGDDTPLHDASSNGFPDCVKLLVDAGADVFALNSDKQTPLDVCDDPESARIIEHKIKELNRLVAKDETGRTLLHKACSEGNYDEAALLLKQGANANAQDKNRWTPLHEAARFGSVAIAKVLVQHGADINYPGQQGNTALHTASISGHEDLVHYLLEAGADVDATNENNDSAYNVTTFAAIRRILAARIDELRKQRTASDAIDEITFISHTKQRRHRPDASGPSRPLSREERKIQAIMRSFEVMEQNKRPRRARRNPANDEEMEDDDDDELPKDSKKRRGPARRRQKSCSADVGSSREPSVDPEVRPQKKSIDKLDPRKKDTSGRTQLHKFAIRGDVNVVETLLKAGANPNESDNAGWTPLHEAALRGRDQVVQLLLENGADANSKGADQDTALHDAVENNHVQVIGHLLKYGASPHARNAKGLTPLEIAVENGYDAIEQILKRAIVKNGKKKAAQRTNGDRPSHGERHPPSKKTSDHRDVAPTDQQSIAERQPKKRRLVLAANMEAKQEPPGETVVSVKEEQQQQPPEGMKKAKAHARELSGRHLPKKNLHTLQPTTEISPDGPHTPIPTPPPERWHAKVKEEKEYNSGLTSLLLSNDDVQMRPPSLSDAMRYLPLYTVQLFEESSKKCSFFVVDTQVSMLLGLSTEAFWQRYPDLLRRAVTPKEKDRLWSPFSSMLCSSQNGLDVKEKEKRRFADSSMYFVLLEQVVSLIKRDYGYLSQSLITITLDIGYKDDKSQDSQPPALPASLVHNSSSNNVLLPKRPGYGLPPKFAMKLQKCGKLKK